MTAATLDSMLEAPRRTKGAWLALGGILLAAALLRFWALDLVGFSHDEAAEYSFAIDLIEKALFPLTGLGSSLSVATPPLEIYLFAVPLLFFRNVLAVNAFTGLLGVVATGLLFWLGARHFSAAAGLLGALCFAASFWPVFVTRRMWDVGLLPVFEVLLLFSLYELIWHQRRAHLLGVIFWSNVLIQIHPSTLALLPPILVLLLFASKQLDWRFFLAGVAASALSLLPFFLYLIETGFRDVHTLVSLDGGAVQVDLSALPYVLSLIFPPRDEPALMTAWGPVLPDWLPGWLAPTAWVLFLGGTGLLLVQSAFDWRSRERRQRAEKRLSLILLFVTGLGFYVRRSFDLYPHYLFFLLPVIALLWGVLLEAVVNWSRHLLLRLSRRQNLTFGGQALALAPVVLWLFLLVLGQVAIFGALLGWAATRGGTYYSDVPLRFSQLVIERAEALNDENSQPLVMASNSDHPLVFQMLGRGKLNFKITSEDEAAVFPSGDKPLVFLTTYDQSRVGRLLRERFASFESEVLPYGQPGDVFRLYRLPTEARKEFEGAAEVATFANGISLLRAAVPQSVRQGEALEVRLYWKVGRDFQYNGAAYQFFNHLIGTDGQRRGQADGSGYPTDDWRPGDIVVSWFSIALEEAPPGTYRLETGMYDLHSFKRIAISGHPSETLTLGTIELGP